MEKNALLNHEVVMASSDKTTNNFISKMKKEGRLIKIAAKIYTTNLNDTPENIIRRNLFFILGELFPDAAHISYLRLYEKDIIARYYRSPVRRS